MIDITTILKKAISEILKSGLPKPTEESNNFFIELLTASYEEIIRLKSDELVSASDINLNQLNRYINELEKRNYLANSVSASDEISALISGDDKAAMSRRMYRAAQSLSKGDARSWLDLCREAEKKYKANIGGTLPRPYIQTKSNIKRMMLANIDLNLYDNEFDAREELLYGNDKA